MTTLFLAKKANLSKPVPAVPRMGDWGNISTHADRTGNQPNGLTLERLEETVRNLSISKAQQQAATYAAASALAMQSANHWVPASSPPPSQSPFAAQPWQQSIVQRRDDSQENLLGINYAEECSRLAKELAELKRAKQEEEQAEARANAIAKCPFQKGCEVVISLEAVETGSVTAAEYTSRDRFVVERVVSAHTSSEGWWLALEGVNDYVFSAHVAEAPPPPLAKPPVPLPTPGRRRCMNL